MNIRRLLWVIVPLVSVACYSAPEWPARIEMLDDGLIKNSLYETSVKFKNVVESITFKHEQQKEEIVNVKNKVIKDNYITETTSPPENITSIKSNSIINKEEQVKKDEVKISENNKKQEVNTYPHFVLTIGDSLMSEVSQGLRSKLNKDIKIKDVHKSSTGLTNIDYYDWPDIAYNDVKQYQPDTVIIHMGGNDGQDMKIGKVFVHIDELLWRETYMQRAELLISKIKEANPSANIIWLGLPEMRDTKFAKKMNVIRSAQYDICNKLNIKYIDGKDALGKEYKKQGVFEGKIQNWRRTDGIHYTREGGIVMANTLKDELKW